ncbi:Na/Pi cotransporter family protein [Oceanibaculum indicum]|uniref:Phosphate:Na+ symporter n=1 Tax=Oceanibaculum indicum TaxID=526216 RepID=A0A420WR90_9PROT|nr:Na/Pi symporter [Oceanibaculum indicum]RKQ73500.1 phosphate:Na+ symporter [Oceanibaculum indicum]
MEAAWIIATILGGLGLFFAGSDMLTGNLRSLANRRIQQEIARVASSIPAGLMWGAILGAITQSTQIVTFILVGLLMARMIDARRALPMIVGANVGASVIIFVVTLDIEIVVLMALGGSGILMTMQRFQNWQAVLRAVFGLCLLYYGLVLLKMGAAPIAEEPFFKEMMAGAGGSPMAALAIGAVLTLISQSSVSVSLLAIAFAASGLLSFEQTVMVAYGTNLGSSIATWLLSGQIRGTARQVAMYQFSFNIVGCIVLVPLFYTETLFGFPPLMAAVQSLSDDVGQQIAFAYLFFNMIAGFVLLPLIAPSERLLARLYPPTEQEDESRLAYLSDHVAGNPEIALIMAEKEQLRLLQRLTRYIDVPRLPEAGQRARRMAELREAFRSVHRQAGIYIDDLADDRLVAENHERVYRIVDRHSRLETLEAALAEFAEAAPLLQGSAALEDIRIALIEGLDAVLLSFVEAMESGDPEDMALIQRITGDRGELMEGVRRQFLSDETVSLGREEKLGLLQLTGLFERLIWMLREMTQKAPLAITQEES